MYGGVIRGKFVRIINLAAIQLCMNNVTRRFTIRRRIQGGMEMYRRSERIFDKRFIYDIAHIRGLQVLNVLNLKCSM